MTHILPSRASVLAIAMAILGIASGSHAMAQTEAGPTCQPKTLTIDPLPAGLELGAFSVDPLEDGPACVTTSGGTLTLVSVNAPGTLDPDHGIHISSPPAPGQSLTVGFTVQDQAGNKTSTTLTIVRR